MSHSDITTNDLRPVESATATNSSVEQKLTAARTRLILDKPFLGALVLRLPLVEAGSWCQTSGTDARSIFYNPSYIDELNLSQVQYVLAHEALHCGLSHFARREHRDRKRWDVACDHAINQLLEGESLEHPPAALINEEYSGMSAEEIYPCIEPDNNEEPMDQHLYDPDFNSDNTRTEQRLENTPNKPQTRPPPLNNAERDQLDTKWQQRLAGAAQQAANAGKLSESIARILERLLQPTIPWRALLSRFMSSAARIDYNLTRPSQRREGEAILPSLHTRQIDVAVAIDTSGSIKQDELDAFLTELNAIKGSMNARITLLACDAEMDANCPWVYEPWDPLTLPGQMHGGGTTDFRPVFNWLATNVTQLDLLIYFTDAKGRFPPEPPRMPILWLVKGNVSVPWGQRIQLN